MTDPKTRRNFGIANIFVFDDRSPGIPCAASIDSLYDNAAEKRVDWRKKPPANADATITISFAMVVNLDFLMSEPVDVSAIDELWSLSTGYMQNEIAQGLGTMYVAGLTLYSPSAAGGGEFVSCREENIDDTDECPELERFQFSYIIVKDYEVAYDPQTVYKLPEESFFSNLLKEVRGIFCDPKSDYMEMLGQAISTNFFHSADAILPPDLYCRLVAVDITDPAEF